MSELSLMGIVEILPNYLHLRRRLYQDGGPRQRKCIAGPAADHRFQGLLAHPGPKQLREALPRPAHGALCRPNGLGLASGAGEEDRAFHRPDPGALSLRAALHGGGRASAAISSVTRLSPNHRQSEEAAAFREKLGIAPEVPLILALPGSRGGEIKRLAPVFGAALVQVLDRTSGRPHCRAHGGSQGRDDGRGIAGMARNTDPSGSAWQSE